ncbi:hypothetical protein Cni_G15831 [Canna indica]|uniref:Uncharacterized protein n=1 Tax=Canna indica TaxID=4628 RepID=A0AAQ3QG65_9LILI|nr:hypothetical protein Cni_G15831 [Canna indica]
MRLYRIAIKSKDESEQATCRQNAPNYCHHKVEKLRTRYHNKRQKSYQIDPSFPQPPPGSTSARCTRWRPATTNVNPPSPSMSCPAPFLTTTMMMKRRRAMGAAVLWVGETLATSIVSWPTATEQSASSGSQFQR